MRVGVNIDSAVVVGACPGAMVDQDGVATPAESGTEPTVDAEGWSDDDRRAKADSGSDDESGTRCVEDDGGVVDRNVVVRGIDGLDLDVSAVVDYVVVGGGGEIAVIVRGLALTLDGVHDVVSLNEDGVAESARPLRIARHHVEHGGKGQEGEHAGIPGKVVGLDGLREGVACQVGVLLGPGSGVWDLLPEGGGSEDLG